LKKTAREQVLFPAQYSIARKRSQKRGENKRTEELGKGGVAAAEKNLTGSGPGVF